MTVNIEQPPMKTDMTQDGKTFTFPWQKWFTQLSAKIVEISKSIGTTIQQYIYAVPPIISDNSQPNRVRILHAESAVHPGTYNNVAVDSYGHITTGSNKDYGYCDGTIGNIAKFIDEDEVGDSIISETGSTIKITGTNAETKLQIGNIASGVSDPDSGISIGVGTAGTAFIRGGYDNLGIQRRPVVGITEDIMSFKDNKISIGYEDHPINSPIDINSDTTIKESMFLEKESGIDITANFSTGILADSFPTMTNNNNGTITVGSCLCNLRPSNSFLAPIQTYTIPSKTLTATDGTEQYIMIYYNSGVPEYIITSSLTLSNSLDYVTIATTWRVDLNVFYAIFGQNGIGLGNKLNNRLLQTEPYKRWVWGGLDLTETPTRVLNISSSVVFIGCTSLAIPAVTSSTNHMYFVHHSSGSWVYTLNTQYNNTQYDNGTDLVTSSNDKYLVRFVYRSISTTNDVVFYVSSNNHYNTFDTARAASVPANLPAVVLRYCMLVGRIIVQYNATPATAIESAFTQSFSYTPSGAPYETGTFTLTWQGFSTAITSSVTWQKIGKQVTLIFDAFTGTATGSSRFYASGMPSNLCPLVNASGINMYTGTVPANVTSDYDTGIFPAGYFTGIYAQIEYGGYLNIEKYDNLEFAPGTRGLTVTRPSPGSNIYGKITISYMMDR